MWCCAVLCCAVLCCAVLCCAVLCCAVLCCAVPCRAVPCRAVPCRAVPCRAVPCSAVQCRACTARHGTARHCITSGTEWYLTPLYRHSARISRFGDRDGSGPGFSLVTNIISINNIKYSRTIVITHIFNRNGCAVCVLTNLVPDVTCVNNARSEYRKAVYAFHESGPTCFRVDPAVISLWFTHIILICTLYLFSHG